MLHSPKQSLEPEPWDWFQQNSRSALEERKKIVAWLPQMETREEECLSVSMISKSYYE